MRPLLAALVLAAASGCAADPNNCCDSYSATEDNGIYCLAHREAVLRYVRGTKDPVQQQVRLDYVKSLLKVLEPLADSDAVDAAIAPTEKTKPEFWAEYYKQHFWAGRDTNLGLKLRGDLMKCGFRHAVNTLEIELAHGR